MQKIRLAILVIILLTVAVVLFSVVLPVPAGWQSGDTLFHVRLGISLLIPALHIVAALLFFEGLQTYKQELRTAYRRIAIGIVIIGFTLLESPMVTFFDLWDTWPMQWGVVNIPYIVAMAIVLSGIRVFFKALNIKSIWRSIWFVVGIIVAGVAIVILVPHGPTRLSEVTFDTGNAMFALTAMLSLVTAISIFIVRGHLAPAYAKVMTWLGIGISIEVVLVASGVAFRVAGLDLRSLGSLQDVLLLASIPYIYAGYLFYKPNSVQPVQAPQQTTAIDVVLYTASLVSSKEAIDPMLDGLRAITSHTQANLLTQQEEASLGDIYLELETYITQKEPLRSFTPQQLRALVHQKFDGSAVGQAFWQKLAAAPMPPPALDPRSVY